ncbi:hypothetical protein Hanom_Chr05g00409871 [Helianthus anomalus]
MTSLAMTFTCFLDGPSADAHGDGEVDDVVVLNVPPPVIHVIELSSDSSLHSVSVSFESMTSSALRAAGLQLHATDSDDDTAILILHRLSQNRFLRPLIVDPYVPQSPPVSVAPPPPVTSDAHRTDLLIVFLQEIPHTTPFTPFTSAPLDEPFRWLPPYTMPISDPYHLSHFIGYTRVELLLSLQLQIEIFSRRVLELELGEGARRSPCPCHSTPVPPHSSSSSFIPPPAALAPFLGFDARFLTVEQQISFLLCHDYELEEELTHVRSLLFFPPHPLPSAQ